MIRCIQICFLLLISDSINSCKPDNRQVTIHIEINYGAENKIEKLNISKDKGITALEALQYIAEVETHPVGEYVFVSTINKIKADRGKTAWYYKVNGKSPKVLAINDVLNNGDIISWQLKEDVCSRTVNK